MSPSLRLNCGNRLCDERLRSLQGDSPVPIQTTASIQGPGWKNQVQTVHTVKKKTAPWNPWNHCRGLPLDWAQRWLPLQILRHPAGEICRCRCQLSPEISRALKQTAKVAMVGAFVELIHVCMPLFKCSSHCICHFHSKRKWKMKKMKHVLQELHKNYIRIT